MDYLVYPLIFILVLVAGFFIGNSRRFVLMEYERGLLYRNGKFQQLLEPGAHRYFRYNQNVVKVDMRARHITILGQEVLSADNISLKLSLAINFRVTDPYRNINASTNPQEALYLAVQIQLRDLVGSIAVDDLLSSRKEIGAQLTQAAAAAASELGYAVLDVNIKDIMFPGELKNIYAQVVNAQKEGLAALERARGETAALRNLANAGKMLENNTGLLQLRLLQAMHASSGNTFIVNLAEGNLVPLAATGRKPSDQREP